MYVQSLSKASVAVSNAADPYNSTPLSYAVTDGRTTGTAASYTTGLLPSAGTVTLTATVTNARRYKTKKTKTITVEAYTPPVISSVELQRCLAPETDGTLGADDPMGTYVRVKAVFSPVPPFRAQQRRLRDRAVPRRGRR